MLPKDLTLKDIFQSSGNLGRAPTHQDYLKLFRHINNGFVNIERRELKPLNGQVLEKLHFYLGNHNEQDIDKLLMDSIPELIGLSNGGGQLHKLICLCAAAWLIDLGYTNVESEQRCNDSRVDITTTCRKWIVECGDTSPQAIIEHLYRGTDYVAIIPFQGNDLLHLEAVIFCKSPQWDNKTVQEELIININQ